MQASKQHRLRVAIIANALTAYGGGELWVLEASKRLKKHLDITVINPVSPIDEKRMSMDQILERHDLSGVKIVNLECTGVRTKLPGLGGFIAMVPKPAARKLLEWVVKESDVVYAVSSNPFILFSAMRLAKKYGKKAILGLHNPELLRYASRDDSLYRKAVVRAYNMAQRRLMDYIGTIHVQTESQMKILSESGYKGKSFYITHYLFNTPARPKPARGRFVALFVSRLVVRQKGMDMLEKIVDQALARNSKIEFHIVGSGKEGEPIVRALLKRHPRNVKWFGFVSEKKLQKEYENASLFVVPSRYETPSIVLIEAQSHGVPAVAFDVPGPRDIMKRPEQGVMVRPFDISGFCAAIQSYYEAYNRDRKGYNSARSVIYREMAARYGERKFVEKFVKMVKG